MFQFFKKPGQKDRPRALQTSSTKSINSGKFLENVFNDNLSSQTSTDTLCGLEEEEENEMKETISFNSQLSKSLPQILADKSALGYFIQFMETRDCIALIKYWLEVECLCSSFHVLDTKMKSLECVNYFDNATGLTVSIYNNKNSHCDIIQSNTHDYEIGKMSFNAYRNSSDIQLKCDEMPKTNLSTDSSLQSNYSCKKKNMITITQDVLRIYKKYIINDALGTNLIPEDLKIKMSTLISCENIELMLECLSAVQKIVYQILENEHINDFLRSEFHCKHQIDVLTSDNVQLSDILYNETAFFYFMEFMELENKRELLDFWMSAMSYKQNLLEKLNTVDPEEAQTDALIIYDKYFSLQATMPLGVSNRIRFEIEQNICREDGEGPQSDCFDKPCRLVYNFLKKYYLPSFLSSQLYYKYLSELISTIQSSSCLSLHGKLRKAGSDSSSILGSVNVSMQNILQAGNEENRLNYKLNVADSLSIDTRQLYNPDSLWKRNKCSLSVGYMDSLGRFITEIEPDPQRKYESRLTRAVKRLVNMEHDKAKEELAWKIAEMIVREITSLTIGTSNISS